MKQLKSFKNKQKKKHLMAKQKILDKKFKNKSSIAKNNSMFNNRLHWKLPTFILIASLLLIILIVPSLIVTPALNKDNQSFQATERKDEPDKIVKDEEDNRITVEVMRHQTNEVEKVPLETYVSRVVANEMHAEFELEALKAQALAARTYIVNHLLYQDQSKNVTDTTADQVYSNEEELRKRWGGEFSKNMAKIDEAVHATKGKILTYNNAPIFPAFFSTSNGYTENSEDYWENELPYLRSVKSPWDENSPKFLDQKTLTIEEVAHALNIPLSTNTAIPIELTRTNSQRVKEVIIEGHTFSGREVREYLNLNSSDFKVKQNGNHLIFTTKGFGHGVGMSQYGANGMAKEGKSYEEIVKYYYQDVEISTVSETAPALVSK